MDTTKTINHLSLCSGYEGIGSGLSRVLPTLRNIAYVEREGFPAANLVAKMEAGALAPAPVHTDVKTFPFAEFRGKVDILSGGFPCQPFSCAGKRKATDDPRHLFPAIRDGIRDCQPRIVFLENVQGIISAKTADGDSVLHYVLRELEELGYRATAGIFSAAEVGAPHQRKRVFILGYSSGERCEQDSSLRSEQQSSWTDEVSGESRDELADSEDIGRGGRTHRDGDDGHGLSEQATQEQSNIRSQAQGCSGDSRREEELGNTSDLRLQQSSADSRETSTDQSGEERGVYEPQGASSLSRDGSQSEGSQELADRIDEGSQGWLHGGQDTQRQGVNGHAGRSCSSSHRGWPSRPGEPQHDWEEPRVTAVGNTTSEQGSSSNHGGQSGATSEPREVQSGGGHCGSLRSSSGQAQSGLGRASNGSSQRVDRLRLLGNGVVPATAAKAFITLLQKVYND